MHARIITHLGLLLVAALLGTHVAAGERSDISVAPVVWIWFDGVGPAPVGTSKLVRTDRGIQATFQTEGLPPGHAMTMWFVVFNNPEECFSQPCGVLDLMANEYAQADFLWGAGNIVGGTGSANFGGSLSAGDTRRSAFHELGASELAVGLTNPRGAEVHLLIHSHGPTATGATLRSQLNSFLGGCEVFLGPDGLAEGFGDIPDELGECSTIQASVHQATP